jgi:peptidoglycan hydrolase-like protein with peptidoglycan-binding domain
VSAIGVVLNPGNSGDQVNELHNQLKALGGAIAPDERNAKNFGQSAAAAVRTFRQRYGLPASDTLDLSMGRLLHAAAAPRTARAARHCAPTFTKGLCEYSPAARPRPTDVLNSLGCEGSETLLGARHVIR